MAKIVTKKQNIFLALLILIPLISVAQDRYEIRIDIDQFQFESVDEYIRILTEDKNIAARIGQPELPVLAYRYYIPSSYPVNGINVVNTVKERLPGEYIIYPAQPESEYDQDMDFIQPDSETYTSTNAFPGMPAIFGGTGFKQGYQIATVSVFPFEYIPSEKALYFYSYIEFEFVYSKTGKTIFKPREDYLTVKSIKSLVENSYMIGERPLQYYSVPKGGQAMTIDSVPCVIITNVQMQQVFEEYAWWKTKTGTRTEVMRVDVIDLIYPGDSLQEKIRNYITDISDCETGQCTQWIILAGDIDVIPAMHVNSNGKVVLTDLYYSNLQGDWNADGDTLFGEC